MKKLNVLLIGSSGRAHAMASAIAGSDKLKNFYVAPGNGGTDDHSVALDVDDHDAVVDFCTMHKIDLVAVGPEAPLVAGLADRVRAENIACFGPSKAASRLEGSKEFAREFASRHGIPGPKWNSFTDSEEAVSWFRDFGKPVVVKADGLAAGKGVIIPEGPTDTVAAIRQLLGGAVGDAGTKILLEERMEGEEVSVFGLADGAGVALLATAQDHKRVGEGDTGPNTGGMGAFAPVPGMRPLESEFTEKFLVPVVQGMAAEGTPYVGVIYAGLMLTADGPRLVEYNCRFGDPEAQAIIPLIASDFVELMYYTATGELPKASLNMVKGQTAAAVVVAADGYPSAPVANIPLDLPPTEEIEPVQIFHAGTRLVDDQLVSSGGRVLTVSSVGTSLEDALESAYRVVDRICGPELFARGDIGHNHYKRRRPAPGAYEKAGVSIDAGAVTTRRIAAAVKATHTPDVVSGLGSFGGVFDVSSLSDLESPVLVASTDGVGTKTLLAAEMNQWESIGADIVNHCINDVLVQGAKPLFFMDTVASAKLDPEVVGRVVDGMSAACVEAECVLLGGETAEMSDVLTEGSVDVSGTLVGVAERRNLLPNAQVAPGHILIGMASSGLHTNGYSLARKVVSGVDLDSPLPEGNGVSIGSALLEPHRSYLPSLRPALAAQLVDGLCHITGGGLIDNLPRVLPKGCGASLKTASWKWPALFRYLASSSGLEEQEAYRVFNLGVGMVAIVDPAKVEAFSRTVGEKVKVIGEVTDKVGVSLD